jgi:hypothetical protein
MTTRKSPDAVAARLRKVEAASLPDLRAEWERLTGRAPPPGLRSNLLRLALAYRIQEEAYGGLDRETRRRLREIAAAADRGERRPAGPAPLRPGTALTREWQGRTHAVNVLAQGFEYQGKAYKSLSEIARVITGTRWSGPKFFGLRGPNGTKA